MAPGGATSIATAVPSAKKTWTMFKLYSALRDLPELVPLFALLGGAVGMAGYTLNRVYFSTAGEAFPEKHMRQDMEKQISYGQEFIPPSIFWRVAQWRRDKNTQTIDVGVWPFENRSWVNSHEIPTHEQMRQGVPAEGPSPTEY